MDPFRDIEVALRPYGKAGWRTELAIDHRACSKRAAGNALRDLIGKYAASLGGADKESFTVQEEVHGLPKLLAGDLCNESPRLDLEDLHSIPCFIRYVEKPAVHNDPAHGMTRSTMDIEHHIEALRRRNIPWYGVAYFGEAALSRCDQGTRKEVSRRKFPGEVCRHGCGFSRLQMQGNNSVSILT